MWIVDDLLGTRGVAGLLGVKPETIRFYRTHSKAGGRYAEHPFPEPDYNLDGTPAWKAEREQEIRDWAQTRAGQGVGGGRPAHKAERPTLSDRAQDDGSSADLSI